MLMVAVHKKLVWHHLNVVAGTWRTSDFAANRTYELEGKTLGIVGLGNIGKKVARRVRGFDMDVLLRHRPAQRGPGGRARRPLRALHRAPPHVGRRDPARAAHRRHPRDDLDT